jgi:hypothetical protein
MTKIVDPLVNISIFLKYSLTVKAEYQVRMITKTESHQTPNICVTNDHGYVPFVVNASGSLHHK